MLGGGPFIQVNGVMPGLHLSDITYWKLAIWKLYYGILTIMIGALPATIMNWYVMNRIEKLIAIGGVVLAVHKFVDGFIDQTLARLIAGKPIVPLPRAAGDTDIITSVEVVEHKVTTQETPKPKP